MFFFVGFFSVGGGGSVAAPAVGSCKERWPFCWLSLTHTCPSPSLLLYPLARTCDFRFNVVVGLASIAASASHHRPRRQRQKGDRRLNPSPPWRPPTTARRSAARAASRAYRLRWRPRTNQRRCSRARRSHNPLPSRRRRPQPPQRQPTTTTRASAKQRQRPHQPRSPCCPSPPSCARCFCPRRPPKTTTTTQTTAATLRSCAARALPPRRRRHHHRTSRPLY